MPLRTIETFDAAQPASGCAFASVTPPCVAQRVCPSPVVALEPFEPARCLQVSERADRADVLEAALLEERDPGRVVAAVLEALEPLDEQRLALPRTDVSDYPAHVVRGSVNAKEPGGALRRAQPSSLSTSAAMLAHRLLCIFGIFRLGQDAHDGLGAGGPHEHAAACAELGVQPVGLLHDRRREVARVARPRRCAAPAGIAASPRRPPPACAPRARGRGGARPRARRRSRGFRAR